MLTQWAIRRIAGFSVLLYLLFVIKEVFVQSYQFVMFQNTPLPPYFVSQCKMSFNPVSYSTRLHACQSHCVLQNLPRCLVQHHACSDGIIFALPIHLVILLQRDLDVLNQAR